MHQELMEHEKMVDSMKIEMNLTVKDLVHVYICLEKSYDMEVERLRKKKGVEVMKGEKGDRPVGRVQTKRI